jgi:uncharacterized protein involved in exopolysaccharide biosynthesis
MQMQENIRNDDINLADYWGVLCRRKMLIISICMVSVIFAFIISLLLPKYYRSETVLISTSSDAGGLGAALSALPLAGVLGAAGAGIQTPADKLMVILKSRTTAEEVIRKFGLMQVFYENKWDASKGAWKNPDKHPVMQDAVKFLTSNLARFTKSKEGSITITVEWKDPRLAAEIANYYVSALTDFLKDKAINITVQVVDKAVPAERKSRPKILLNTALAGVTSLFIGIFIAFVQESLSRQRSQRA